MCARDNCSRSRVGTVGKAVAARITGTSWRSRPRTIHYRPARRLSATHFPHARDTGKVTRQVGRHLSLVFGSFSLVVTGSMPAYLRMGQSRRRAARTEGRRGSRPRGRHAAIDQQVRAEHEDWFGKAAATGIALNASRNGKLRPRRPHPRLPGQPLDPRNRVTRPGTKGPASPSQDRGCRERVYLSTVSWRFRGSRGAPGWGRTG